MRATANNPLIIITIACGLMNSSPGPAKEVNNYAADLVMKQL